MNLTNSTSNICILDHEAFDKAVYASFIVFSCFGVVGNIFIILLAAKYTEKKSLHLLIINMAVSDILVAVLYAADMNNFKMPIETPVLLAEAFCRVLNFAKNGAELLTLITLFIISFERYKATTMVVGGKSHSSVRLLLLSWLAATAFSSFNLGYAHAELAVNNTGRKCGYAKPLAFEALYLVKSIFLLGLYCLVFSLSVATSMRLSKANAIEASISSSQRIRREKRIMTAVRMVLCSLLLYSICYLPDFIEDVINSILGFVDLGKNIKKDLGPNCHKMVDFILQVPKVVNSALSPIVYLVFLDDFKRAAKNLVLKKVTRDLSHRENTTCDETQF